MITGPLAFHDVAQRLLDAVAESLGDAAPDRACVVPAEIAWDECDCGTLVASVGQTYFSDTFPQQLGDSDLAPCRGALLVADVTLQLVRCAPTPEGTELAPSCEDLDASAREVTADAWHLLTAAACELEEMKDAADVFDYLVRAVARRGPQGGCVGNELVAAVGTYAGAAT